MAESLHRKGVHKRASVHITVVHDPLNSDQIRVNQRRQSRGNLALEVPDHLIPHIHLEGAVTHLRNPVEGKWISHTIAMALLKDDQLGEAEHTSVINLPIILILWLTYYVNFLTPVHETYAFLALRNIADKLSLAFIVLDPDDSSTVI